ncbi:MAG TPA: flagellar basal body rod C-terminal domain-containing protein, partial [Rhodocyclaceae bacterium]|nr:flagellar basal body rod C-terminal domain-containing protein [Rhodocyclaceae bacterium]
SDYKVAFGAGGAYTVTRLSDNTAVAAGVGVGSVVVDGLSIAIGAVGASGDSFIVQPTRSIARDIDVDSRFTTDPRLVAAAAPVRTQATLTNTGNMVLAQGSVNTGYSLAGLPLTLTANTGAGTLTGFPAAANVVAFYADGSSTVTSGGSVALSNGGSTLAKVSFNGMTFTMSGAPANGDSFTLATNGGGVDDSRNGLLLAQLQISNTIAGGTATYQSSYAQLVADNGIRTREAQVRSDAQTALLQQSQASREALSGVNLDEEAANLIKFQQAYQASAKMLEVGSRLFETILDLG